VILGDAVGSPMNVVATMGAYAAVMRELGRPLCLPRGGAFVNGAADARLLARARTFAGTSGVASNETYNVVNGDVLVWQDIWAAVAAHFGMPAGPAEPLRLAEAMPRREDVRTACSTGCGACSRSGSRHRDGAPPRWLMLASASALRGDGLSRRTCAGSTASTQY